MLRRFNLQVVGRFILMGLIAVIVLVFTIPMLNLMDNNKEREVEAVRQAVSKALVQCYALEGSYPATIEYLAEHYGVQLQKELYIYYYVPWAVNFMPELKIIPKE